MTLPLSPCHRRTFLAGTASAVAAATLPAWGATSGGAPQFEICAFEKFIQDLSYDELADVLAEMGFHGVEATVRRGGRIDPPTVEEELPRLQEALARRGLAITVMTTDVKRADDPVHQKVVATGAKLGIKRYRLGFWRYDKRREIVEQLDELRPQIKDLAELNREHGIQGLWQNHSGADYVGATIWDLHHLLRDVVAAELGVAFDIRHATVEASLSWSTLYRLIKPHIGALFVKDFAHKGRKVVHAPLGSGVDPAFFEMFLRDNLQVPVSLHVEYLPRGGTKANIESLRSDLKTLKKWLKLS